MLISHICVSGCFVNCLVIFRYIWGEIVFLKELVKIMEIEICRFAVSFKIRI